MNKFFTSILCIVCFSYSFDINAQCLSSVSIETLDQNCQDNPFGEATITPLDGAPPYTYAWSGGTFTTGNPYTITNLIPGAQTITITDNNNCEVQELVTIEMINIIIDIPSSPLCAGDCVVIDAGISGVCFPISYEWFDQSGNLFSTGSVPFICEAGTYTCRVTSCDGCYAEEVFDINIQDEALEFGQVQITQPSCGACDGDVNIDVSGGSGNYTYSWRLNGIVISNDEDVSGLCEGLVELFVSDVNGCTIGNEWELECSGFFLETYFETTDCANICEAFAVATPEGGSPPYNWVWSNGADSESVFGLCPGNYSVTVVDALNAVQVAEIIIEPTNPLTIEFTSSASSCSVGGIIEFVVTAGSGDYSYFVNGTEYFTTIINNLPPGNKTLEIIDNQTGCIHEEFIIIGSPYDVGIVATETDCDVNDGTATAIVTDGMSTYTYLWSNGNNNATATGLAPGGYSVTVTDTANNCQSHENVIIEQSGDCFVTISGFVIDDDVMADCEIDPNSGGAKYQLVSLNGELLTFTDLDGFYSFEVQPGTYELVYESESLLFDLLCLDPITVTVDNFGDVSEDNNFYVDGTDVVDMILYLSKTPIRPGFNHFVNATGHNNSNNWAAGTFTYTHDINQNFIAAIPPADSYDPVTREISWNYSLLEAYGTINWQMQFTIDATIPINTLIEGSGDLITTMADIDLTNNIKTCSRVVTGSYDPNDKTVEYPVEPTLDVNTYMPGELKQMTYRIRFQNTGTDTAFTVVIEDQLDNLINVRNVIPGPASHPYEMSIRDGNTLAFTFDNILLPDSTTNEAASHGFVYFDVKIPDDIFQGDVIPNQAAIFFDYNVPIITNEVFTYFDVLFSTEESDLFSDILLQPNPTTNTTTLFYTLKNSGAVSIDLLDISGKNIQSVITNDIQSTGSQQVVINTTSLSNGTYFVRIRKDNEIITRKLVIIK